MSTVVVPGLRALAFAQRQDYRTAVLADNPIAYWRLDEPFGFTANDSSPNGNDGLYVGGGSSIVNGVPGATADQDFALKLNAGGFMHADGFDPYVSGAKQTFECFALVPSNPGNLLIFGNDGGENAGVGFGFYGGGVASDPSTWPGSTADYIDLEWQPTANALINVDAVWWPGAWPLGGDGKPAKNQWFHIVLTWDDAALDAELFINGVKQTSKESTLATGYNSSAAFLLGIFGVEKHDPWVGNLDEFAVYDYILSDTRIAAHYASSLVGTPLGPANVGAGLMSWWKADALALSNGDPVTLWPDSSHGRNALAPGALAAPTFETDIAGSLPGVLFTAASTQGLKVASSLFDLNNQLTAAGWTLFFAFEPLPASSAYGTVLSHLSSTGLYYVEASKKLDLQTPTSHLSTAALAETAVHVCMVLCDGTNTSFNLDGTPDASYVLAAEPFGSNIGTDGSHDNFNGYMFEMAAYNRALSSDEQAAVLAYLTAKWG